jgi:hypothetical protein
MPPKGQAPLKFNLAQKYVVDHALEMCQSSPACVDVVLLLYMSHQSFPNE